MNTMTEKNGCRSRWLGIGIIGGLILAAVLVLTLYQPTAPVADPEKVTVEQTGEQKDVTGNPTGYVLCRLTASGRVGLLPLPETEEVSYPIKQAWTDGTETENILHLTPNGFYMESSTCDNQNCVNEGEVNFENRETRVLLNCVVCLPNQVMAELYTAEEVQEILAAAEKEQE